MADRDLLEKIESLGKAVAAFAIPAVLTVAGFFVTAHLEEQKQFLERDKLHQDKQLERDKLGQVMLTHAIDVVFKSKDPVRVFGDETTQEGRRAYRAHWVETYNAYAQVKITEDFVVIVMEQETRPEGKTVVKAETKEQERLREPNQNGDGWVSIGRISDTHSNQTAHLNFELLAQDAINKDHTVKPGTMVRARWRVNLHEDLESSKRPGNLLASGECAKVIESRAKVRGQTWAKIDVLPCNAPVSAELPSPPRG